MRTSVDVHTYLLDRDIPHEIYPIAEPLRILEEACDVLGLDPASVVRVTLFAAPGGRIAALAPLGVDPHPQAVAAAARAPTARPETLAASSRHSGYLAHWIPPVAHERSARVVIDPAVLAPDIVYAAGGEPGVMLKIRAEDLVRATGGVVADLQKARLAERP